MKIQAVQTTLRQLRTDAIALFVPEDKKLFDAEMTRLKKIFGNTLDYIVRLENFHGKESETISFLSHKKIPAQRVYLAGVGKVNKISPEQFRRSAASVAKHALSMKLKEVSFRVATSGLENSKITFEDIGKSVTEGAVLSLYTFDKYLTEKKNERSSIKFLTLFDSQAEKVKSLKNIVNKTRIICEGTILARNLANAPACEIYPETLAEAARASAEKYGYSATIWDKKRLEKEGFGGLLAVNAGSARPPRFIILEYNQGQKNLDTIVLIGKGITFDSGGISIKPSTGMAEMKMDMSGAAAVIGTMESAARLSIPLHIVGLIPSTENLPSGSAMKPGDIIRHYGGKTSEVDNTDAEGRLILADALVYATQYNPAAIIDLATLTGACVVALGSHATGMMGNDDEIMKRLTAAGNTTYERVWQLPLFEEYEKQIKSDIADVKNVGGRWAGAITAALFLKKFLPKNKEYKWVHLDIAGTAMLEEALPYTPKGGSGVGVRLLIEFLQNWNKLL
jgi:leucyl aminopeptidase